MKSKSNIFRMKNLRRVVQMLFFLAFLYLFVLTIGKFNVDAKQIVLPSKAPIDTFFRIDPLLGLTTMIAARQLIYVMLIYALPVVILTILAGRFFCGWICPLGTVLDATDVVLIGKRKKASPMNSQNTTRLRNTKYYILVGMLVAAAFSTQFAYLLDPMTIITRAFTFVVFPIVQLASRTGFAVDHLPLLSQSPYIPSDVTYFYRLNLFAALFLVGILAANLISRRFWCRNLCPLGALLGIISRFSIVRRVVKSDCIKCKKCIPDCKTGAIEDDIVTYHGPECIYCYSCTAICPSQSTTIVPTIQKAGYHSAVDLDRRRTVQAMGLGALFALLPATNLAAKVSKNGHTLLSSGQLIRPPGALPEDEFIDRCIRCSECMKVCPTNGLQPALTEAGIGGLWTPVLVPRSGECTQNCNMCSQVCSTQAIQPFEKNEKSHIFMGTAVIDRSQCLAWNSDKVCIICDECCSYHALYWKEVDGVRRPFVEKDRCVGCGICENACPVQPVAAIRVFSHGDRRHLSRDEQKRIYERAPKREEAGASEGSSPYSPY